MDTNSNKCLSLPLTLRKNLLSYEETLHYWELLDGRANDKKVILSSTIQRNIIDILPGYKPNTLDCVRINNETFTAYFKPKIKGSFLCVDNQGREYWMSGDMIGLIATIKAFKTYADKNKDGLLMQMTRSILKDVSNEFKRLAGQSDFSSASFHNMAVDIKNIHTALKHWLSD